MYTCKAKTTEAPPDMVLKVKDEITKQ